MQNISNDPYMVVQVVKTNTPNYHTLVAKGIPLPVNPYLLKITQNQSLTAMKQFSEEWYLGSLFKGETITSKVSFSGGTPMGECGAAVRAVLDARTATIQGIMTNNLLKKIKSQSLGIALIYKDRKETGKLLLSFMDKTIATLRNVKRPERVLQIWGHEIRKDPTNKDFLRLLKKKVRRCPTVGDAFMQYKFAWTPTYHDIVESLRANEEFEKRIHTFSHKSIKRINVTETINTPSGFTLLTSSCPTTGVRKGWCKAEVHYCISDISLVGVASFMDVPTSLWDMVPYSFVIDRVVDISSFLDLQNATIGLSLSSGFNTLFYEDQIEKTGPWYTYNPDSVSFAIHREGSLRTTYNLSSDSYKSVYMNRMKLTDFPSPTLEYPLRQSFSAIADEVILARRLMKRRN